MACHRRRGRGEDHLVRGPPPFRRYVTSGGPRVKDRRRIALVQCGVDIPHVIWILLVVLTVLGGVAAVGIATNERRKALAGGGGTPKQLGAGGGDKLLERTVRDLRVDDVLTIDGKDFICEGAIFYDEDGHRWVAGRCVDGTDIKWVVVGIDRTGTSATRLLVQDESTPITGYPPEAIVVGTTRYALDKRGTATCALKGD